MTIADLPRRILPPTPDGHHRFTREEYYDMAERGFFEGQRVELIDGEIIHMARQNFPHMAAVSRAMEFLPKVFGPGFWVTSQANLNLLDASAPEPDFAVVSIEFLKLKIIPNAAHLVIEISESSLQRDRAKAALYAAAGIPEYWIVNLVDLALEVHRDPVEDATAPFGKGYASIQRLAPTDVIRPLARPDLEIQTANLFP